MDDHRKTCVRYNEPGHAHALTFSCDERAPLFETEAARDLFIQSLAAARAKLAFDIWAYVIMPEHVHLLIWPREAEYSISAILQAVKQPVSYYARKRGLYGGRSFWLPGGGYDRNMIAAKTVHEEIEYLHANPVRRGLCKSTTDWRYSNARFWAGLDSIEMEMDRTVPPKE